MPIDVPYLYSIECKRADRRNPGTLFEIVGQQPQSYTGFSSLYFITVSYFDCRDDSVSHLPLLLLPSRVLMAA